MNITITFRHMNGSESLKAYAQEKVAKLQKFLRQTMTAQVILSVEGLQKSAEVRISSGDVHLQGSETNEDMHAAIDAVHDKLLAQIRSVKDTDVARRRHGESTREFAESVGNADARAKS